MSKKRESYRCWFLINQNKEDRPFSTDEEFAAKTFSSFLADKDYGQGIGLFRFDIYIEPIINYGNHHDSVYTGCAHLSANIDYSTFINADSKNRLKLLLNAVLILCKYLSEKVVLPKDFDVNSLITDLSQVKNYVIAKKELKSELCPQKTRYERRNNS